MCVPLISRSKLQYRSDEKKNGSGAANWGPLIDREEIEQAIQTEQERLSKTADPVDANETAATAKSRHIQASGIYCHFNLTESS